jgi:hypothetical protein
MKELIRKIFNQKNPEIPKPVRQSFKRTFIMAKNEEWTEKGENWEAIFYLDKRENIAVIDREGTLVEMRTNIAAEALPPQILNAALTLGEIMNAISISGNKGKIYEIIVRDKELTRHLAIISADGKLMSHTRL